MAGSIDDAIARSREGNPFSRAFRDLTGGTVDASLTPQVSYSAQAVLRLVDRVRRAVDRPAQDGRRGGGVFRRPPAVRPAQAQRAEPPGQILSAIAARHAVVLADREHLTVVLQNLVRNALAYGEMPVVVGATRRGETVCFREMYFLPGDFQQG